MVKTFFTFIIQKFKILDIKWVEQGLGKGIFFFKSHFKSQMLQHSNKKMSLVLWNNIITDYLHWNGIDSKYSDASIPSVIPLPRDHTASG